MVTTDMPIEHLKLSNILSAWANLHAMPWKVLWIMEERFGYSIVLVFPQCLSVHSVEYFLGVDEVNIEGEFSFPHSIMIRRLVI